MYRAEAEMLFGRQGALRPTAPPEASAERAPGAAGAEALGPSARLAGPRPSGEVCNQGVQRTYTLEGNTDRMVS